MQLQDPYNPDLDGQLRYLNSILYVVLLGLNPSTNTI